MKLLVIHSHLSGEILIPGSKSHTIRALAIATMADGKSILRNALLSDDTRSCIDACMEFGAAIEISDNSLEITGINGSIDHPCKIYVGNSGTTLRILTAMGALSSQPIEMDGDGSIRKRQMFPLLNSLAELGASVQSTDHKCPFTIRGPIRGNKTEVDGISSQFLTALLLAAPLAQGDTEILVHNLHEKPYINITLDWMDFMGIQYENEGLNHFRIHGSQKYHGFEKNISADFSSATFPLCAAAVTGSDLIIKGLDFSDHQGDKEIFSHAEKMGLKIFHKPDGVYIKSSEINGIDIDMNATPDALPAMAVLGCYARGTTRLLNVKQARYKECDRISAIYNELTKMGGKIEELEDGLVIHQSKLKGSAVHGYDDHRMVMALAIAGMGAEGETTIDTAESMGVTYPTFVEDFQNIGATIRTI